MKKSGIPIIFLLVFAGLFGALLVINPPNAFAVVGVSYSSQNFTTYPGYTLASITVQTAASTQLLLVWVMVGGDSTSGLANVADNQSNTWTFPATSGLYAGECAGNGSASCSWGYAISSTDTHSGHANIQLAYYNYVTGLAISVYDVSGGVLTYQSQSHGNSNTAGTTMSVISYTPTAGALIATEAFTIITGTNTYTAGAGYTLATGQTNWPNANFFVTSEYEVAAGATTSPETTANNMGGWFEASMAFTVASGVTQALTLSVANSAPSYQFAIYGCGVTNNSMLADGFKKTYTGLTPSCVIDVRVYPRIVIGTSQAQYCFNDRGTCGGDWYTTTAGAGTGTPVTNTSYYTLLNSFTMNPPAGGWNSAYSEPLTGTYVGTAVTLGTFSLSTTSGSVSLQVWSDYGRPVYLPASFASTVGCGGSYTATTNSSTIPIASYIPVYGPYFGFNVLYALTGVLCTTTYTAISTIVGINAPSPAGFAAAIGPEVIPLFVLVLGVMLCGAFRIRGDFGVSILLGFFALGNLIGMLHNGAVPDLTPNGVIPLALTVESVVFFLIWMLAGGGTSSR